MTESVKKLLDQKEESNQKLNSELKQLKQKLAVQEKTTAKAEAFSKKYLSALVDSKLHASAMLDCFNGVLGEKDKEDDKVKVNKDILKDVKDKAMESEDYISLSTVKSDTNGST